MGFLCCFGSADPDATAPRPARTTAKAPIDTNTMIEKLHASLAKTQATWQKDDAWEAQINTLSNGNHPDTTMHQRIQKHIDSLYPHCARAGTMLDRGDEPLMKRGGATLPYTLRSIQVLDGDYGGVYAAVAILNLPADADMTPGKWLDTPEMEEVKDVVLYLLAGLDVQDFDVKHAVARIFIGGDALWCKFRPDNTEPTIHVADVEHPPAFKKEMDSLGKEMRHMPGLPEGLFRSMFFKRNLADMYEAIPGCTVWDEGPLPPNITRKVCIFPTRLLVARVFETQPENDYKPTEDVDAAIYAVYSIGEEPGQTTPVKLLQTRKPGRDHGGIAAVTLFMATPLADVWPKCGAYTKSPIMEAAKASAVDLLQTWNRQGKIGVCTVTICMGLDSARIKFISENYNPSTPTKTKNEEAQANTVTPTLPPLEPFYVAVQEQDQHELFDSEVQFQAIKQLMRQRAAENPERFREIARQSALRSARHFLETNYPGCEIVDEGACPATIAGETTTINDTRLVAAKDPNKDTNNVIAAMLMVPLPGGDDMSWQEAMDRNWLDTKEIRGAEQLLLGVLKQWFKERKLADDCMAQVVMGTDATIYRFADGERFVDYPEERQKQFKWQ